MKSLLNLRFRGYLPVVIDFETAGVKANASAIIQVAAAFPKQDKELNLATDLVMSWNVEPHPDTEIDKSTYRFHKINLDDTTRDTVSEKYAFTRLFQATRKYITKFNCKKAIIVAHNANFELSFLQTAVARNKIKHNPFHSFSILDTATIAAISTNHTVLAQACKRSNIKFNNSKAHNAIYDTIKTAELFFKVINEWDNFSNSNITLT